MISLALMVSLLAGPAVAPLPELNREEARAFALAEAPRIGVIEGPFEFDGGNPTSTSGGWRFPDAARGIRLRTTLGPTGIRVSTIACDPGEMQWVPFLPGDEPVDEIATLEDLAPWAETYRAKLKLDEEWHERTPDLRPSAFQLQDDGTTKRQIGKAEIVFERRPGGYPTFVSPPERKVILLDPYGGRFLVYRHLALNLFDASSVRLSPEAAAQRARAFALELQLPWPDPAPLTQGPGYAYDAASFERMKAAWRGLNGDPDPAAAGLPPDADRTAFLMAAVGPQPYGVLTLVYAFDLPPHRLYVSAGRVEVWESFQVPGLGQPPGGAPGPKRRQP